MIRLAAFAALVVPLALVGCGGDKDKKEQQPEFKNDKKDDHSDHDRGQFKVEDVSLPGVKEAHGLLTAHLSKKGEHELEVIFETTDKEPKRIPVAITEMTGRVTRKGDDKAHDLKFVPAPKEERKDDPEGKCSHFTAEAKWMKPDDELTVLLNIPIDGKIKPFTWPGFIPKKYGHEAD